MYLLYNHNIIIINHTQGTCAKENKEKTLAVLGIIGGIDPSGGADTRVPVSCVQSNINT